MGKKFTVLGGDKRSVELANLLKEDGNEVLAYGFNKLEQFGKLSLKEAIENSEVIVGPLPFSSDNKEIESPFCTDEILIEEVLRLLSKEQIFLGGKIHKGIHDKAKEYDLILHDYFSREEMQVFNAIPTAEGAVQIAMEEMKITLHGSNAMVLGYGRIGKALAKLLYGIGANVYVVARDYGDLAWIKNNGYKPVHLKDIKTYLPKMNVVFNTIPQRILEKDLLGYADKSCLIIDIASLPGGVNIEAAKELNLNAIRALGLPGKAAPVTAAKVIMDTIYNIISELEV